MWAYSIRNLNGREKERMKDRKKERKKERKKDRKKERGLCLPLQASCVFSAVACLTVFFLCLTHSQSIVPVGTAKADLSSEKCPINSSFNAK